MAHPASYTMITGSFPEVRVKRPGRGVDHPPPSRFGVKERVELYLHSPSGSSRSVLELILTLPLLFMGIPAVYCENRVKHKQIFGVTADGTSTNQ